MTANREIDVDRIRECIEKDPALVAKLLRVANSSLYCTHGVVRDLRQALTLIGLNPLRLLVLGFCLPERLLKGIEENVLAWYWRNTLTKAIAAREFATFACPILADEVFVSGLLRDIGMLLLIQELDKPYLKLVDQAVRGGIDLREIEREAMGFDHVQLSRKMMEGWGLPASLRERAGTSDETGFDTSEPAMASRVLRIAELATDLLANGKTSVYPSLLEQADRLLRIDESRAEAILDSVEEKVLQLADVLALELPKNLDYHSLLASARDRLIQAADAAAEDLVHEGNRDAAGPARTVASDGQPEDDVVALSDESAMDTPRASSPKPSETGEPVGRGTRPDGVSPANSPPDGVSPSVEAVPVEAVPEADVPEEASCLGSLANEVLAACGSFSGDSDSRPGATAASEPSRPEGDASSPVAAHLSEESRAKETASAPEEPQLSRQLRTATAACNRLRCPVSLLAVDFTTDPESFGADNGTILKELLRLACQTACGERKILLEFKENGRAVILLNTDRDEAVSTAHEVLDSFLHAIPFCFGHNAPSAAVDIGVVTLAMPPSDYDPNRFVDAVSRCLYASHASGGNRVKSVDIG